MKPPVGDEGRCASLHASMQEGGGHIWVVDRPYEGRSTPSIGLWVLPSGGMHGPPVLDLFVWCWFAWWCKFLIIWAIQSLGKASTPYTRNTTCILWLGVSQNVFGGLPPSLWAQFGVDRPHLGSPNPRVWPLGHTLLHFTSYIVT
jgi:hypothetical protein